MIKLNQVNKTIKTNHILKDMDLELHPGQTILIRGHNGSGKTTLLRTICELFRPTSGEVLLSEAYRFGIVLENPSFFEDETALFNLKYLAKINQRIQENTIEDYLEKLNLNDYAKARVKTFSLGMKQRLV